jgi:hypothetical protein
VSGQKRTLRNAVALGASALVHLVALAVFLVQGAAQYQLPEPETPPVEVEIVPRMEVIPPPEPMPPIPKAIPERQTAPPVTTTPKTQPVTPQPTTPQLAAAPTPAPPRIKLERPALAAPAAPKAPLVAKPSPSAAISATPVPTLIPTPSAAPAPVPPRPAPAAPAASTAPAPVAPRLNIHKSEKEAPAETPTLPMAPSSTPPPAGGGRPAAAGGGGGGGEPGIGGSRLQGLVPYPPGSMPGGGSGLRGSLVGCANAQAVGLSSVERAHCESRFGVNGASAPHLDGIAPDKRAAFDRAADSGERDRAYRGATSGPARWTVAPGGGAAGGLPSSMSPLKPSSPNGSGP